MDRVDESVCSQEITEMLSLNEEAMTIDKLKEPLTCVTDNPAFAPPPGPEDEHTFVGFRPPSEEDDRTILEFENNHLGPLI